MHVRHFKDGNVSFNSPILLRNAHKMFDEVFYVTLNMSSYNSPNSTNMVVHAKKFKWVDLTIYLTKIH